MDSERMPKVAEKEWLEECDRAMRAFCAFVSRWPNCRLHVAYALLASAIASVDMMGGDADGYLRAIRASSAKPTPLVPPPAS